MEPRRTICNNVIIFLSVVIVAIIFVFVYKNFNTGRRNNNLPF